MWTILSGFDQLKSPEMDALVQAPVLITVLIGAADGELDKEERYWAERLVQVRTYHRPKITREYYTVVFEGFLENVDKILKELPSNAEKRNHEIAQRLEILNAVLAKLDPHLGAALYKSFLTLASETAKASGGFLRIGAISAVESKWVTLPMLTPVTLPEGEAIEAEEEEEEEKQVD